MKIKRKRKKIYRPLRDLRRYAFFRVGTYFFLQKFTSINSKQLYSINFFIVFYEGARQHLSKATSKSDIDSTDIEQEG